MRSYVPNTAEERADMLKVIGLPDMDALYADIPEAVRLRRPLDLPRGMSESDETADHEECDKHIDAGRCRVTPGQGIPRSSRRTGSR
jgi:glycine cleavage system pyridoxal-binding protein P